MSTIGEFNLIQILGFDFVNCLCWGKINAAGEFRDILCDIYIGVTKRSGVYIRYVYLAK